MITIEIIKEYKSCWKVGQVRPVRPEFAAMLIRGGYAKQVDRPPMNKMVEQPVMEK